MYHKVITFFILLLLIFQQHINAQSKPGKPVRIMFLVDGSSSMLSDWQPGISRYKAASSIIISLIDSIYKINPDAEFAVRLFGHQHPSQEHNCYDTKLEVDFSKDNVLQIQRRLANISPKGFSPIAWSIKTMAYEDFNDSYKYAYSLILVTDGGESCGGDVCATVQNLLANKISFKPYILSLIDYAPLKDEYACMGNYIAISKDSEIPPAIEKIIDDNRPIITMQAPPTLIDSTPKPSIKPQPIIKPEPSVKPAINILANWLSGNFPFLTSTVITTLPMYNAYSVSNLPIFKNLFIDIPKYTSDTRILLSETPSISFPNISLADATRVHIEPLPTIKNLSEVVLPKTSGAQFMTNTFALLKQPIGNQKIDISNLNTPNLPEIKNLYEIELPKMSDAKFIVSSRDLIKSNRNNIEIKPKIIPISNLPTIENLYEIELPKQSNAQFVIGKTAMGSFPISAFLISGKTFKSPHLPLFKGLYIIDLPKQSNAKAIFGPSKLLKGNLLYALTTANPYKVPSLPKFSELIVNEPPVSAPTPTKPTKPNKPTPPTSSNTPSSSHVESVKDADKTKVAVYFTNGKGKYYTTEPDMVIKDSKTGKVVWHKPRTVGFDGTPDPFEIPEGIYDFTFPGSKNKATNVNILANKENKVEIVVSQGSLAFQYGTNPNRPVKEYTALVSKRFEDRHVTSQKCDTILSFDPDNYHIEINTLPPMLLNVDISFGSITMITIEEAGTVSVINTDQIGRVQFLRPLGDQFVPFYEMNITGEPTYQVVNFRPGAYKLQYVKPTGGPNRQVTTVNFKVVSNQTTTIKLEP